MNHKNDIKVPPELNTKIPPKPLKNAPIWVKNAPYWNQLKNTLKIPQKHPFLAPKHPFLVVSSGFQRPSSKNPPFGGSF